MRVGVRKGRGPGLAVVLTVLVVGASSLTPAPAAAQERSQRFAGTTREAGLTDGAFLAREEAGITWGVGGAVASWVAGAFGAVPAVGIAFVAHPSLPRDAHGGSRISPGRTGKALPTASAMRCGGSG